MSGGVDSAVAAALLRDAGHAVTGVTLKLWGGRSDSGCCSVGDVEDARAVARRLGIEHHVFNYGEVFETAVVKPYVEAHGAGRTPNPCVECNRHVKFGRLLERAKRLGFDGLATGHHARVSPEDGTGRRRLLRGRDHAKDQSYVLSMLTASELDYLQLPVGELEKAEVRRLAGALGLRVAGKPDSQDVCFVASRTDPRARSAFLGERTRLHPARLVDARDGGQLGEIPALELVTIGQRRGLGTSGGRGRRFVVDIDPVSRTVLVGGEEDLLTAEVRLVGRTWTHGPMAPGRAVEVQTSAHGCPRPAVLTESGARFEVPARRVAPGQTVAIYVGDEVAGSGTAT